MTEPKNARAELKAALESNPAFRVTEDPRLGNERPRNTQPQRTQPQRTQPQRTQPQSTQPQSTQPQSTQPQKPQNATQTPPPLSLKEKLLQQASAVKSAEDLRRILQEADEAGRTPAVARLFGEMVERGDEIGIQRFSFTRTPEEALQDWYSLSWLEWERNLRNWAQAGDTGAGEVMETIDLVNQNIILRDLLRDMATLFVRPCRGISTYGPLIPYLEDLVGRKLAQLVVNPRYILESGPGVIIKKRDETRLYLPEGIRISQLGWRFIKEAEARAKKRATELELQANALKAEATPGLTPLKVSAGEGGKFFLALGRDRGILIEAQPQNGLMMARVVKAVGVHIPGGLPSQWVLWNPEQNYIPLRGANWPLEEIPKTLKTWEQQILRVEEARANAETERLRKQEEYQEVLAPVTSVATPNLPIAFGGQALTRLLNGEIGVVAMYNWNFQWDQTTGLFAIAVERREGEEFLRLQEFVTYHPFPGHLRGKRLPRLVIEGKEDGSLQVQLSQLPKMKRDIYEALKMIEKLIRMRLNAEHRALAGEPAPGKENNRTG